MKNYWELEPTKVQVFVKDQNHLDELFEMCESFGQRIYKDRYKNSHSLFRFSLFDPWFRNHTFSESFTVVNTDNFYEILCHNHGYKGELEGFDKEVVLRMLECQEEQKKNRDIKAFELDKYNGFDWSSTKEGIDFWKETITNNKGKFPDQKPILAEPQELETETQSKEVDRLNAEIESLKFKNNELESEQIRLRNINRIMSEEITSLENSYRKLKKKNKKLKKIVRHFIKK